MANTKISQLTALTTPTGGEELVYAYNNANGKMTLNTMKGYVENNLSGYVTDTDLADDLATKQDTLVSGTNIKTINGSDLLGSGNLDISGGITYTAGPGIDITGGVISATGGGGLAGGYDAVVDVNGTGDYTTIGAAISAGKTNLLIKNGTYTMESLQNQGFILTGESKAGVIINIDYSTRSGAIFNTTTTTNPESQTYGLYNLTMSITYTGAYGYISLFSPIETSLWKVVIDNCNIKCKATHGCNFYISTDRNEVATIKNSYISVSDNGAGTDGTSRGYLGAGGATIGSTIKVDCSGAYATSGATFECSPEGTHLGCMFYVGEAHQKDGDFIRFGATSAVNCRFRTTNSHANIEIGGNSYKCTYSGIGRYANFDSDLATAAQNNQITQWKPNTAYTVGAYVWSGSTFYIAKCKTAHTSGDTYDSTYWDDVKGDISINGNLNSCTLNYLGGNVVVGGISHYNDTVTQPAMTGNITNTFFHFEKSASGMPVPYLIILGNRGFNNNIIDTGIGDNYALKSLIAGTGTTFTGNRFVAPQGSVYVSGTNNVITDNIYTYHKDYTPATISGVAGNNIDNNIIIEGNWEE